MIDFVSIPFIAGQWSLRKAFRFAHQNEQGGFNPLHCGAVVASAPGDAVVDDDALVSIPFIAGQWSLPPVLL